MVKTAYNFKQKFFGTEITTDIRTTYNARITKLNKAYKLDIAALGKSWDQSWANNNNQHYKTLNKYYR